jgi:hypothetical protein
MNEYNEMIDPMEDLSIEERAEVTTTYDPFDFDGADAEYWLAV